VLWLGLALVACVAAACGNDGPESGENYGNLLLSPGGLVVLESEHPTGFGRPDCQTCHERRNSHIENRTGLADCADVPSGTSCIDLHAIQELIVQDGTDSCVLCHGTNGVEP
jgi:hypothetical protein